MAGGQEYSKSQRGIINRYYDNLDTIALQKLGEIVSEIYLCTDAKKKNTLWKSAYTALQKTSANPVRVQNVVARRSVEELAKLLGELTVGGSASAAQPKGDPTKPPPQSALAAAAPGDVASPEASAELSPDKLKSAMRAFKKRLKLTRLDDESKLTVRPLTSGGKSEVMSMVPPNEYPRAVWDELARQGKLKYTGHGFFELTELGEKGV